MLLMTNQLLSFMTEKIRALTGFLRSAIFCCPLSVLAAAYIERIVMASLALYTIYPFVSCQNNRVIDPPYVCWFV